MIWGIEDVTFLAGYGVAAGAALLGGVLWRWYATAGGDREHEPGAVELGYLIDGPLGACHASIAGLRRAGAVTGAELRTIVSRGAPPAGASTLSRALHGALGSPATWSSAVVDGAVARALTQLKRRLLRRGWLLDPVRVRRARLAGLPLLAIGAVGTARLVVVVAHSGFDARPGAQVGLAAGVAVTLVAAGRLVRRPRLSTVARREVRWARRRRPYLSPRADHNWAAASPRDLMFAVALYGPSVLRACDPDFARLIGADPRERAREQHDVELALADGVSRMRRRRPIRLWARDVGSPSGGGDLGWLLGGGRPNLFWRTMWRLRNAWR